MTTRVQSKNVYFARHGERIDWIDKTWLKTADRSTDPPLSPYGLQQAHELGVYIAGIKPRITHIYASPFLRTIQTALQAANELNKNVTSTNELTKIRIEPGYGEYFFPDSCPSWNENSIYRPLNQILNIVQNTTYFDEDYDSIIKADYYLQMKKETRQQLRHRLQRIIQNMLDIHITDCNILIVTHAAPLIEGARALATISQQQNQKIIKDKDKNNLAAWDMLPIRAGVCSLTHFELLDDKWTLSKNGFASYLSKGEQNPWIFSDDISLYEDFSAN